MVGFLVALGFLTVSTYGLFGSYGVFIAPLETELGVSRTAVSAVYTIYMSVYNTASILMACCVTGTGRGAPCTCPRPHWRRRCPIGYRSVLSGSCSSTMV